MQKIETEYVQIQLKDNILFCAYSDQIRINLDIAKQCVKTRLDFCNGKSYRSLVHAGGVREVSKEARKYLATKGSEGVIAGAIIINNPLTKMMGNLYLQLDKPSIPSKLFTSEEEAIEWLKSLKI